MNAQLRLFEPIPADILIGKRVQSPSGEIGVIEEVLEWQNIDSWMTPDAKARHIKVSFPQTYMKGNKEINASYHVVGRLDSFLVLS